jgi:predicted glycosyltransferase involved in capsule biosynthesis
MNDKKLGIIIPYRDRLEHLTELLPQLSQRLTSYPSIQHKIVVVEQKENELFNRGQLKNIGTIYCDDCDYFCFHDVDMIPDKSWYNYSYNKGATLLATKVKQFNYTIPYFKFFGGVVLIDKEDFKKVNGYSNAYWHWGSEDDDFRYRCELKNIDISSRNKCRFDSYDHARDKSSEFHNRNLFKYFQNMPNLFDINGLNSLDYTVISNIENQIEEVNFKHITVSLNKNEYHP